MQELRKDDKTSRRAASNSWAQVGKELLKRARCIAVCFGRIVGYLALRFEWKFGVAAIIANLHDVVIILGFFSIFQWSLAVGARRRARHLGYSVNESV